MNRALQVGMAHEFPAVIVCLLRDARVVLTNARIDGERRSYFLLLEQIEKTPYPDPHAVFMPAPVRHVGQMRHSGGWRQHLARHRFADVPDFKIDDAPEYKTRFIRKLERRPIDDGGIMRTLARQHRSARSSFLGPFHVLGRSPG